MGRSGDSYRPILFIIVLQFLILLSPVTTSVLYSPPPDKVENFQEGCGINDENGSDGRTRVPWNAAIFLKTSAGHKSKPRFLVTGTIVGPSTIVGVLGGAFGQRSVDGRKYFIWPPSRLLVGAGLNTTNLDKMDNNSQLTEVRYILPFPSDSNDFPEYHFFLLHLKTPFDLTTPYVKTVCLPLGVLDGDVSPDLGLFWLVHTSGFVFPSIRDEDEDEGSFQVKGLNITAFPLTECVDKYSKIYNGHHPYRPYCASGEPDDDGKTHCLLPGGRVIIKGFMPALLGLVHNPPSANGSCTKDTLYFYAGILPPLRWIRNNLLCGPDGFSCSDGSCIKFWNVCDGVRHCPKSKDDANDYFNDENLTFCRGQNRCSRLKDKIHECGIGEKCIRPDQVCDGTVDCPNNASDENIESCQVV